MLQGIQRGIVTPGRLNEAVGRVLALKASLGLATKSSEPLPCPHRETHRQWAQGVARTGVTLVKDTQGLLPLDAIRHRRILLYAVGCGDPLSQETQMDKACARFQSLLEQKGFEIKRFSEEKWSFEASQQAPSLQLDGVDLVLYVAHTPVLSNQTTIRLHFLTRQGTISPKFLLECPTLFVSLGSPYHLQDIPRMKTLVNAYADNEYTIEALVEALVGEIPFVGRSPVDPYCGMWDAML